MTQKMSLILHVFQYLQELHQYYVLSCLEMIEMYNRCDGQPLKLRAMRRRAGGGQGGNPMGPMGGPMDFGRNKSKFQEVPETGITFDDVAVRTCFAWHSCMQCFFVRSARQGQKSSA